MSKRIVNSPKNAKPVGPFVHAVEVSNQRLLFLSGVVGRDKNGVIQSGDIRGQATQCFENIRHTIEEAGGTLSDIVKITTFIRDWNDYPGFNEVRLEVLAGLGFASSTVQATLYAEDALVEVEAIAAIFPAGVGNVV